MNSWSVSKVNRRWLVLGFVLIAALLLAACGPKDTSLPAQGNPLPTARPEEDVGSDVQSQAKDTPEGTWEVYLRDMIAFANQDIEQKLTIFRRYQNPEHLAQNVGGTMQEISLLEDKTEWDMNDAETAASTLAEFDIRVEFLDGDSETKTCVFEVQAQYSEAEEVWYIINPIGLAPSVLCR